MTHPEATAKPEVLIVGAGIGGLLMGILLEQIKIPYHIFERAAEVKSLGSAMAFGGDLFPSFVQLGIYEDLLKVAKPYDKVSFYDGEANLTGEMDLDYVKQANGYPVLAFTRPDFYNVLRKRIPAEKISFKKKIVRTEEKDGKVTIHCGDETFYTGDILIGADGAHSGVRQSLYKRLEEKKLLPQSDLEAFSIGYTVIVGIAKSTDYEKYPALKEEGASFNQVLYSDTSNCYIITLPDNQISWGFGTQLPQTFKKDTNAEWSAGEGAPTLEKYRKFPSPIGGTMGDMFDATPKELISNVYLEEKLFKTWHHGRTVLLGDACHKLHPAGGSGGKNAIEDAIVLANCLYAMKDTSIKSITGAFEEYYNQRFPYAQESFDYSTMNAKVINGQKWYERLMRYISLSPLSGWIVRRSVDQINRYRQQVAWLPLIPNRGTAPVLPQKFNHAPSVEQPVNV